MIIEIFGETPGIAGFSGQFFDATGSAIGAAITTGFTASDSFGNYEWAGDAPSNAASFVISNSNFVGGTYEIVSSDVGVPAACSYGTLDDWIDDVSLGTAVILLDPGASYQPNAANGSSNDAPNSGNPYGLSNNQLAAWFRWGKKADGDIDTVSRGKTLIVPLAVGGVALSALDPSSSVREWYAERWSRRLTWLAYQPRIIASASAGAQITDGDKAMFKLIGDPIAEVTAAANGDTDPGADKVETPSAVKSNSAISVSVGRRPYVPGASTAFCSPYSRGF